MDVAYSLRDDVLAQTVEQLDGVAWPEPADRAYVATATHALRRKKLRDLDDEELRLGLGQQVGVRFLVPLAVERLRADALLEAALYPGDLLQNLLDVPGSYWDAHPDMRAEAAELAAAAFDRAAQLPASWQSDMLPALQAAHERFTGHRPSRGWLRPGGGRDAPAINPKPAAVSR